MARRKMKDEVERVVTLRATYDPSDGVPSDALVRTALNTLLSDPSDVAGDAIDALIDLEVMEIQTRYRRVPVPDTEPGGADA